VGIVGLGRIGSRVAKRLQGWECEVVYHDIAEFTHEYVSAARAERVDFHQLLRTCDVVTLHVPLEPTTKHLMSDKEFAMMKKTAILINTCRGPVVDEAALARALQSKTIHGAAIDVTEVEPLPMDSPLLKLDNIIITPHQATRAVESTNNAKQFVVENITRLARGEKITSIVNPVEM
jgi:glyoxylate reductase